MCRGPECGAKRNSQAVYEAFRKRLAERGLEERVELGWQSCFGRCTQGPNALVREVEEGEAERRFLFASPLARRGRSALYNGLEPRDVVEVIEEHILRGRIVRRLIRSPARARRPSNPEPASDDGES